MSARSFIGLFAALLLVMTACSDGESSPATTSSTVPETTTTITTEATTTTVSATTTTTEPPTPLEALGFPVSDEWVVETVVRDIDSGTGGLSVDTEGNFYLGDFGYPDHPGDRVHRITPEGEVTTYSAAEGMSSLTMNVFGPDGTLYQSSFASNTVFAIDPDGTAWILVEGLSGVRGPTGIVVREDGSLVVEGFNSSTLYTLEVDGTIEEWVFDRRFNGINGIAEGPDGTLYLADFRDGALFAVESDGTVDKFFQFPEEGAHLVYLDGSLFVTSRGGYVVYRYDLETDGVEIIAGRGEPGDSDGRGAEAAFGRPNAITVGPDGHLYINHGTGTDNDPVTIKRISHQP